MGLYKQPNDWTCGPFALKHGLVALGKLATEEQISRLAKPNWWSGTDEMGLARAARKFDCDLPRIRRTEPQRARNDLIAHLNKKIPVLLCVDDWGHWITVVRHEAARFVIIDSRNDPVIHVVTWKELCARWRYEDENYDDGYAGDVPAVFDLHPVTPRFGVKVKAQFSVQRAQFLRRPENRNLSVHWDEYLGDLLEICAPPSTRMTTAMSMAEFLRRRQRLLLSRVTYWHGDIERETVARMLNNFLFVAQTYDLVIPESSSLRALTDLAILLGMWSAAAAGIGSMYGSPSPPGRKPRKR